LNLQNPIKLVQEKYKNGIRVNATWLNITNSMIYKIDGASFIANYTTWSKKCKSDMKKVGK
jgi:hypothetical protein